jgi:hypothetical protein
MSLNNRSEPHIETPARSVGELKQLLGATQIQHVTTGELSAPKSTAALDVTPGTKSQLNWKPGFYAESDADDQGDASARGAVGKVGNPGRVRVTVTRLESESLIAAGARRANKDAAS